MIHSRIIGTGAYAPKKVLTNHDLEKMVETSDAWILERTGIKERHICERGQTTSDLATDAAHRALKAAGIAAADLDMIICGTLTPDSAMPSLGCVLQAKLHAKKAFAFDLYAACSGFLYGLCAPNQTLEIGV